MGDDRRDLKYYHTPPPAARRVKNKFRLMNKRYSNKDNLDLLCLSFKAQTTTIIRGEDKGETTRL